MADDVQDNVLITGVAGFGGSALARALLARGYRVTGLDVLPPSHATLLRCEIDNPNFRYLWKSLQDIQPSDVEGHSIVAHLAAQADAPMAFESPRYTIMQNVDGSVAVLEAVRRAGCVQKLISPGSGNQIGRPLYLPIDENHPLTPHNPYGFSKAASEMAMWTWRRSYGVPAIMLSTGVVVGPHMRREIFIFKWLWNALNGKPIVIEGGKQTRDLVYIADVIDAWLLAIESPPDKVVGQKFFIGSGEERTIEELAYMCRDAVGSSAPVEYTGYRPGEEGQREAFDNAKARRELGYQPKASAEETVRLTAEWVKSLIRAG